jgi:hypothetical protein
MADPELMERVTGLKIHPAFFDIEPQGCRLLVVVENVPEKFGMIEVPQGGNEQMGCGYVMGVGPFAGVTTPKGPMPAGMVAKYAKTVEGKLVEVHDTKFLLYAHVIIGRSVGMPIIVSLNPGYNAQVVIIDEKDVKAVDYNSTPMKIRAEEGK